MTTTRLYIVIIFFIFAGCSTQNKEQQEEQGNIGNQIEIVCETSESIAVDLVANPIVKQQTSRESTSTKMEDSHFNYNNQSTEVEAPKSDYNYEENSLEEQRKHSPNDNYLLGFDEDVDDIHDMELYIEDY